MRLSWDEWGMMIAGAIAARADCSRRRVGAVILDRDHRVAGTGYNGAPPGRRGCLEGGCPRGLLNSAEPYSSYDSGPGMCVSNHAEANALLYADRSKIEGGTMYVTDKPCAGCTRLLANSGLSSVHWPESSASPASLLQDYLLAA